VSKVADLNQALKPEKKRTKTPEERLLELGQKEHEKAIKNMRRKHEKELKKARKKGQPRRSIIKVIPN
jgi:dsDNA-specific endonuclease/ATPase MutS2